MLVIVFIKQPIYISEKLRAFINTIVTILIGREKESIENIEEY